ncbi:MAG TPA: caspase family protein [Polyangia bacterium]|nr:caspase family protein [Polyangia bacterium]
MSRAPVALALFLLACGGAATSDLRPVSTNPLTGLELSVFAAPGAQYAHPAHVSEAVVRSALLSDGNFVESDVTYMVPAVTQQLAQLAPGERLLIRTSSSQYHLFVERSAIVIVNFDAGAERSRSTYALVESGPAPQAPVVRRAPPAAAPVEPPAPVEPAYRPVHAAGQPQNVALVIGIEKYRDLPRVDHARADAERMSAYLRDVLDIPDDRMVVLLDGNAGRTDINKYIDGWLPKVARGANRLYFYFAGHGSPDVSSGAAHLVPYDGDPRFLKESALDLNDLYRRLSATGVREVVVMLDACFTGSGGRSVLPKGARPLVRVDMAKRPPAPLVVIAAAGPTQITGPYTNGASGLFTFFLMEGLHGPADADGDGQITADELIRYVRPRVEREARKENRDQTPELIIGREGSTGNDVVLVQGIRPR